MTDVTVHPAEPSEGRNPSPPRRADSGITPGLPRARTTIPAGVGLACENPDCPKKRAGVSEEGNPFPAAPGADTNHSVPTTRDECPPPKTSRCGACKLFYYCDAACQAADWPRHKPHCRKMRESGHAGRFTADLSRLKILRHRVLTDRNLARSLHQDCMSESLFTKKLHLPTKQVRRGVLMADLSSERAVQARTLATTSRGGIDAEPVYFAFVDVDDPRLQCDQRERVTKLVDEYDPKTQFVLCIVVCTSAGQAAMSLDTVTIGGDAMTPREAQPKAPIELPPKH